MAQKYIMEGKDSSRQVVEERNFEALDSNRESVGKMVEKAADEDEKAARVARLTENRSNTVNDLMGSQKNLIESRRQKMSLGKNESICSS